MRVYVYVYISVCEVSACGMDDVWLLHHIDASCGRFKDLLVHFFFVSETFRGKKTE